MNLAELEELIKERHLLGHWYPEGPTRKSLTPYLWKGSDIFAALTRAANLIGGAAAGGRQIQPRHPNLPWGMSNTIHCTVRCVMPGERARAHRTIESKTLFVISGSAGASFIAEGEAFPMEEGDLLTAPSWVWQEYSNESNEPTIWLEGLEDRLVGFGAAIEEDLPGAQQSVTKPDGFSARTLGHVRPSWIKSEPQTPPRRYAWRDTEIALTALKESKKEGDPYDGICLLYANPMTGGSTLPTRSLGLQLVTPSLRTGSHRHNCTTIYYAFRGQGVTLADEGELEWTEGDLLMIPPWTWHSHENRRGDEAILFSISDRPAMVALELYREERR